jgi:hypothetical protein
LYGPDKSKQSTALYVTKITQPYFFKTRQTVYPLQITTYKKILQRPRYYRHINREARTQAMVLSTSMNSEGSHYRNKLYLHYRISHNLVSHNYVFTLAALNSLITFSYTTNVREAAGRFFSRLDVIPL